MCGVFNRKTMGPSNLFVPILFVLLSGIVGRVPNDPASKDGNSLQQQENRTNKTSEIHGRVHPSARHFETTTFDQATASPYWEDPEGLLPNAPPVVTPEDLTLPPSSCKESRSRCDTSYPYRRLSGWCNNVLHPEFGSSDQPVPRMHPPVYDYSFMRTLSVMRELLPNPRTVSLLVRNVPSVQKTHSSLLVMQMGQFIDHDLAHNSVIRGFETTENACSDCASWRNPLCAPIPIPMSDPFMSPFVESSDTRRCLPFIRSGGIAGRDVSGQPVFDQANVNTAFLDLSTVYGSTTCQGNIIRLYTNGMLKEEYTHNIFKGMPQIHDAVEFDSCVSPQGECFFCGDSRCNEHVGLLTLHIVYLREHNRIARKLQRINHHWNDEKIFQEARRINIAQYQHMVYREFLPALLGVQTMRKYSLSPSKAGYSQSYNVSVNPGILNEFATAAFRVGHTMIPNEFILLNEEYEPILSIPLTEFFNNINEAIPPGNIDSLLRGIVGTRLNGIDLQMEDSILNNLFIKPGLPHSGEDLFARNIARGRDHGIAPYYVYLHSCLGIKLKSFNDLKSVMSVAAVENLQQAYSHVQDVDLHVGILAEIVIPGGLVGPTAACIIAKQFWNTKHGDRFWYENKMAGFSPRQLQAIRASSIVRVLCDNMDEDDTKLPLWPFKIPMKRENPLRKCSRMPKIDLTLWADKTYKGVVPKPCHYLGQLYQPSEPVPVSSCLHCFCRVDGKLDCERPKSCSRVDSSEFCVLVCGRYFQPPKQHKHLSHNVQRFIDYMYLEGQ